MIARPADRQLDLFIKKNCICATCVCGIDRDLFGNVFCNREDSMAGGWNPAKSCCEEHSFRLDSLDKKFEALKDAWYEEAEASGDFDPPEEP